MDKVRGDGSAVSLLHQPERGEETAVPIGVNLSLKALINVVFTIVQIPLIPP